MRRCNYSHNERRRKKTESDSKGIPSFAYLLFYLSVAFVNGCLEPLGPLLLGTSGLSEGFLVLRHLCVLSSNGRFQVLHTHLLLGQRSLQCLTQTHMVLS